MLPEKTKTIDSPPAPSLLERCFTVVVLLYSTGAFVNLFISPGQLLDSGAGIPALRDVWAIIYLVTLVFWLRHCKGSLKLLQKQWPIALLTALALASALWSNFPEITLRRTLALIGTCLIALYFAARYRLREQLKLLVWMCGLSVVLSFVFGWFHWGRSVDELEGAWYGVYTQRNELGSMMVLSALVFLLWGRFDPTNRWKAWLLTAAAFALNLLSGSVTSLIVFFFVVFSFFIVRELRKSSRRVVPMVSFISVFFITCAYWLGTHFESVTEAMGRDPSLTGRTELWAVSGMMALERPLLGYGYNAFWLGLEGPSADVWQVVGWTAPGSHNGLLGIWLDLGLVGVVIAVFGFGLYLWRSIRLIRKTTAWEFAWPLMFLITFFLLNLTENTFLGGNNIYWLLYVVTALSLSPQLSRQQAGLELNGRKTS
jgi:exopolysaccharide production protein ExoQ